MSKNGMLGIIIALSIAMVGTTVVVSYGALQAEAAKSGTSIEWCYRGVLQGPGGGTVTDLCFPNHGECNKEQASDITAESSCFKQKLN